MGKRCRGSMLEPEHELALLRCGSGTVPAPAGGHACGPCVGSQARKARKALYSLNQTLHPALRDQSVVLDHKVHVTTLHSAQCTQHSHTGSHTAPRPTLTKVNHVLTQCIHADFAAHYVLNHTSEAVCGINLAWSRRLGRSDEYTHMERRNPSFKGGTFTTSI